MRPGPLVWQGVDVCPDNSADNDLKRALRHVLWVGGSVCAGKTSAAGVMAERYALRAYYFDHQEPFHIHRSVPERQPHLTLDAVGVELDHERRHWRSP